MELQIKVIAFPFLVAANSGGSRWDDTIMDDDFEKISSLFVFSLLYRYLLSHTAVRGKILYLGTIRKAVAIGKKVIWIRDTDSVKDKVATRIIVIRGTQMRRFTFWQQRSMRNCLLYKSDWMNGEFQ
mmetsp:Transcript_2799/g.4238  ORF Transcript_2799/g.4238 Transcript_2799/m.4238 type:complete len:127 (+) Transcript_2799:3304-3684(+)